MTRSPFACRNCGYLFGRRHHSGRLHVGCRSDLSFELDGRSGPFARLVCPICGANRVYAGGPVSIHAIDIARFAGTPPNV
jgi:hypothetical protein